MRRRPRHCLAFVWVLWAACAPAPSQRPPEIEAALRVVKDHPNDTRGYLHLARLYLRQNDYLRARQYLGIAEKDPGRDVAEIFRIGVVIAVRSGQFDDAIVRCKRELERKEDPGVRALLAVMLESVGDLSGAELQRQLVIEERPQDLHQLIELARFYQRTGNRESQKRAAEVYRRYLQKAPTGDDAPQARAALLAQDLEKSVQRRNN